MSNIVPLWEGGYTSTRKWWLNAFKFVDTSDLLTHQRRAFVFFMDMLVHRPTEFRALLLMFMLAYRNLDEDQIIFTQRQAQAIQVARQAVVNGLPPVRLIAETLGIDKSNASRLLQRASLRAEIATFDDLFHVYDSGEQQTSWRPTEKQVKAQMARMTRECAASGTPNCKGTTRGQFALCLPCAQHYGKTREEWRREDGRPLLWLLAEARRIDKEHRAEAINLLYQAHVEYREETIQIAA